MNNAELADKVHTSMHNQVSKRGYAAPVDVLMDIGALDKKEYENWRNGKVRFLEAVCTMNLGKLSTALHEMMSYASKAHLKPSHTAYMFWGKGKKHELRFSKSGRSEIEKQYSTHYVLDKSS
ncbi:hypothetical protein [Butyrivibrio sp. INlla16]|uniref:hypothetical protein n=1 Tax=Butyrivibrio sp. INlla16 TaxID=1520807 RepID=UPI000B83E608|nr:hypothetical protein [Butyrivibrio sp. INlla16]